MVGRIHYSEITMSSDIAQEKNAITNGKEQSSAVPPAATTRGGLRVYKIVVLGDGGVGKSAVTLQFVSHSFLEYHDPTIVGRIIQKMVGEIREVEGHTQIGMPHIFKEPGSRSFNNHRVPLVCHTEDSYQQQAVIDGEAALLDILDTAGQVEFTAMRDQYMRCGEGFMICYSVTDRHSFQEALEYRKLISRVRANEDIPLVLVGNKFDLQLRRKVTTEEGKALADQLGCPFYETSAALRQFIDDAFYSIVRQIRAKERSRDTVRKHSRWWRLRSIFAFIFRRKQRQSSHYSP